MSQPPVPRNRPVLAQFVDYCEHHPEERFWQALCNWSGMKRIVVEKNESAVDDTFYWEGKDK